MVVRATVTMLLVFSWLLLPACSDDTAPPLDGSSPPADGGLDALPDGEVPFELPKGDDGDSKLGETLQSGQVRAGRVDDKTQLLDGIKTEGQVGDFKLYNDRVAFVIAAVRGTNGYSPYGGELLDGRRTDSGASGGSLLGETIFGAGAQTLEATSVGVINDGKDGKAAIIRVIGKPGPVPVLAGFLSTLNTTLPVHPVVDYVLEPDSDALEVRLRFFNKQYKPLEIPLTLIGFLAGDGLEFFADKTGFDVTGGAPQQDWVGLVGPGVSYGVAGAGETTLKPLVYYHGIWVVSTGSIVVPAAGEAQRNFKIAVGGGSPENMLTMLRKVGAKATGTAVDGRVEDAAAAPIPGARVHVQRNDADKSYVTMARANESGQYALELDPGSYLLTVVADGRALSAAVPLTVAQAPLTQDLTVGDTATVAFSVVDDQNASIPAKLIFKPSKALDQPPASFGEQNYPGGAARVVFHTSASDQGQIALPPGEYSVTASRGFEYEIDTATVAIAAGETKSIALKLAHSVDTTGYMCGDFHIHSMFSPDSSDLYEFKVSSFVAEGIELPVATDHEYIADYNPFIAKLGLQKWVHGIVGEELTTFAYGHFNPFPITPEPTAPNRGALLWFGRTPPELFASVRKTWPGAVFQINHPRGQPVSAYFDYVGYDATTGALKRPTEWSTEFDAIEVFNESGWASNKDETVRDWFSFLDRGKRVTATGNSDSHDALNTEVGYPRNYVKLSTDIPAQVNLTEFAEAIKGQRTMVSGGPFVTVEIGGKGMGELVDATAGKVQLKIKVQAPLWVSADTLRVIMGGKDGGDEVKTVTLDASTANAANPVVRYDDTLELTVAKDNWVIVVVQGKTKLDPVVRNAESFAVTNPIYLDVDGNGKYDPPLSF